MEAAAPARRMPRDAQIRSTAAARSAIDPLHRLRSPAPAMRRLYLERHRECLFGRAHRIRQPLDIDQVLRPHVVAGDVAGQPRRSPASWPGKTLVVMPVEPCGAGVFTSTRLAGIRSAYSRMRASSLE